MSEDNKIIKIEELDQSDIKYILDVNKKAISIYLEVEKQNEKILESLEDFNSSNKRIYKNLSELKENKEDYSESINNMMDAVNDNQDKITELITLFEYNKKDLNISRDFLDELAKKFKDVNVIDMDKTIKEIDKKLTIIIGTGIVGIVFLIIQLLIKK